MRVENDGPTEIMSAIQQLWNWVGEQRDRQEADLHTYGNSHRGDESFQKLSAYSNVRLYMRKFFLGLIDFDDEGETSEHKL